MRPLAILLACAALAGCTKSPKIKSGEATVIGVHDAGKPAVLDTNTERAGMMIPAESKVKITKTDPVPVGNTVAVPGFTTYEFELPEPTNFLSEARRISANTGTVDTTVATRRLDNQARLPLLYASIGAIVAAAAMMFLKYPTGAMLCGAAAVVFFLAWQAAGLPSWFWAIGLAAIAAAAGIYFAYERAESRRNASIEN